MKQTQVLSVSYKATEIRIAANLRLISDDLVVFMHGFGCTKETFDDAFRAELLSEFSLCAFDFPGHGDSEKVDASLYSLQFYADTAGLLIDQLPCNRIFMVCHSMGGAVGLIATQGRHDVGCLVSIEGNLVGEDCGIVSRTTAAQTRDEFISEGFDEFLNQLNQTSRIDHAAWAQWYKQADPSALYESARSLVEWSDNGKLLELFKSLRCKAYIYGDYDEKQYLLPKLRRVPTYRIPGSGHFAMLDNPSKFYSVVGDVLVCAKDRVPTELAKQRLNKSSPREK